MQVQKSKKNVQSKKNQKPSPNGNHEEESINVGPDGQSSTSYSSEEDNASQETNGGETSDPQLPSALNLNGKTRASRGSATDPQSLYARVTKLPHPQITLLNVMHIGCSSI
jgi:hypothetical protein